METSRWLQADFGVSSGIDYTGRFTNRNRLVYDSGRGDLRSMRSRWTALTLVVGPLFAPPSVNAQDSGGSSPSSFEEVVVTTRRRVEFLQDIPIAVSVLDSDSIEKEGIRQIDDIVRLSPSLSFNESFSQNDVRVTVRGLTNTRGRSNVAFLVDGIDVTSETTGTNAGSPLLVNQRLLKDVERIEVVRGPQSALYGRAAFAGAISYVTRDPSSEFTGWGGLDVDQYGAHELSGGLSGPLSDSVGGAVNGVVWSEDGYYQNVVSGADLGGGRGQGASGILMFRPTDALSLKARVSWSDDEYAPRPAVRIDETLTLQVPQEAIDGGVTSATEASFVGRIDSASGLEARTSEDPLTGGEYPGNTLEVSRETLVANWDLGSVLLSSFTGATQADLTQRYELDRQAEGRPDTLLANGDVDTRGETTQFSQEVRIATRWDTPWQFTIGGLLWKENRDDYALNIVTGCIVMTQCTALGYSSWQEIYADVVASVGDYRNPTKADTDHWSVYAMAEWQVSDTFRIALEDRYSDEDFSALIYIGQSCANLVGFSLPGNIIGCTPGIPYADTATTRWHAPKFTIDWRLTDDVLLYASAARGVKPGGISLLTVPLPFVIPTDSFLYKPEKLWAYELGSKTTWNGAYGSLLLNAAAFYNDYTDKQTNTTTAFPPLPIAVPKVSNASSAHVLGTELELLWKTPLDGLQLGLGYTWLQAEYDNFLDPTRSAGRIAIAGSCAKIDFVGVLPHCFIDLSGNALEAAPENTIVASASYSRPLPGSDARLLVDVTTRYQDEQYSSQDNLTVLDDFSITSVQLGVENDSWRFVFYIDNLFDSDSFQVFGGNPDFGPRIIENPNSVGSFQTTSVLPDPRVVGARVYLRY